MNNINKSVICIVLVIIFIVVFIGLKNSFAEKTNTEFVEVKNDKYVRMRVWERGAGITWACGTGSCATLVACVLNKRTQRTAQIELDGGILTIQWADNNRIYMTGPATKVFTATWAD